MTYEEIKEKYPKEEKTPLIDINEDWHLKNCVLMITPYVGLDYDSFNYSKFSAVLHGTYHSGTACAEPLENSVLHLMDLCKEENADIDIYLSPAKNSGEIYNLFPDFDSYTPEMLTELKANRIRINSFDFKMRYEEQMNSQTPQSDWARCNDYADITLSFSVTGSKKGYRFLSEKKLRHGIPRGFLSFEDFIYNEYI